MMIVFLDTAGLIALWSASDQWHADATAAYRKLAPETIRFVTTQYVLLECANDAARKPYRGNVVALHKKLILDDKLIEPQKADLENAWAAYEANEAAGAGIIDLVSFAVMRRLGITEAFTNDRHFAAAGFQTLF